MHLGFAPMSSYYPNFDSQLQASRLDISATNAHQTEVKKNGNGNSDTHVEMRPLIEKQNEVSTFVFLSFGFKKTVTASG